MVVAEQFYYTSVTRHTFLPTREVKGRQCETNLVAAIALIKIYIYLELVLQIPMPCSGLGTDSLIEQLEGIAEYYCHALPGPFLQLLCCPNRERCR